MKTLISKIKMINQTAGHNKEWLCELYDDGTVITKWGKIGATLQEKTFKKGNSAQVFVADKLIEKERKGYVMVE